MLNYSTYDIGVRGPLHWNFMFPKLEIPNALRFDGEPGGLTRAMIATPAAEGEIYLQGAHVTRWTPRGQRPVLFVSCRSMFAAGKAIRGGVPVIFPWFGPRSDGQPGPIHGIARIAEWTVESTELRPDGRVVIAFSLSTGEAALRFRVSMGAQLEMELEVRNPGPQPFTYEEGLHTYFAVGDISQVSITGLTGTTYIDKTDGFQRKVTGSEPLRIARETDQVHLNTAAACTIDDPAWKRRIVIEKSGSATTVVWNPWIAKAASLPDMAPDDWKEMICVETVNAGENAVQLAPGASHTMKASIRVE